MYAHDLDWAGIVAERSDPVDDVFEVCGVVAQNHRVLNTAIVSPTAAPLIAAYNADIRATLEALSGWQFASVQLSAAQPGLRPRDLDRSGRRELSALLARQGLMLGGFDLMIPPKDWLDDVSVDRAVSATLATLELAADLGRPSVSIALPVGALSNDVKQTLITGADGRGVALAVHAEDELEALALWLEAEDQPMLGAGIDPAAAMACDLDPADAALRVAKHLKVARLDDYAPVSAGGGGRCPIGEGNLDLLSYRATLSTIEATPHIVVELRDLADPIAGLSKAMAAWGGQ